MNHATEFMPVECLCIPKALFFDKRYENLSVDAKILYSLLLDRKEMAGLTDMVLCMSFIPERKWRNI